MDVRNMRFPTNHFDLIIDKSTIDALLCGDSSFMNTAIMMKVNKPRINFQECQRILKLDGVYMGISYGTPENRLIHYKRGHLKLNVSTFQVAQPHPNGNQTIHYVYMCKKLEGADEQCELKWAEVEAEIKKEENDENDIMDDSEDEEDEERPEGQ